MFKYAFFALFLTIPFLSSTPLFAIPLWVYGSLGATVLLALIIIVVIEKEWETLK
ncbi:MAG: hypothetical protein ABFR02_03670 [Campylobacterota bacterium]